MAWSSGVRAVLPDPILQPKKASWFDRSEPRRDPGHQFLLHLSPQCWAQRVRRRVVLAAWLGWEAHRDVSGDCGSPKSWRLSVMCLEHVDGEGCRADRL